MNNNLLVHLSMLIAGSLARHTVAGNDIPIGHHHHSVHHNKSKRNNKKRHRLQIAKESRRRNR